MASHVEVFVIDGINRKSRLRVRQFRYLVLALCKAVPMITLLLPELRVSSVVKMVDKLERKMVWKLKGISNYVFSRRFIPVLKGTLAYILAFVLIFLKRFDDLSKYPLAYSSMMIVVIASSPGKSVGACIQSTFLAISGVSLGCVGFLILAKLSPWPVAQASVFAVLVYTMAIVKSQGQRWFGFSLLFILNSFNGIYTSYMLGGAYSAVYLQAYYEAYLWGAAIVLTVNLLVLPISSEKELRQTLVVSLEHVGTFAHLLAKGYTLEINDEERVVRDHLNQTIRADFGYLSQKIEETTIEINYSRFSLKDYQVFVSRTRALQQALITAHSNLTGVEKQDIQLFRERFLPGTMAAFNKLRRAVDLTIRDLGNELGCRPMVIPMTQANYSEYMDLESKNGYATAATKRMSGTVSVDAISREEELAKQLASVGERLAAEVEAVTVPPTRAGTPSLTKPDTTHTVEGSIRSREGSSIVTPDLPTASAPAQHETGRDLPQLKTECGMQRLRREFDAFSVAQHEILRDSLISGQLEGAQDGGLKLHEPRGSLKEIFGTDGITGNTDADTANIASTVRKRAQSNEKTSDPDSATGEAPESSAEREEAEKVLMDGHSLIRVWGFLFALEQFVSELEALWSNVRSPGIKPKKRLHVHLFEALQRPHRKSKEEDEDGDLPFPEALALLEKRPYKPVKLNIWQRLDQVQKVIQGPTSIFAAKTAAAASVFATLIYATAPRPWFISYALSSGMLTIVVALAPTLGQSILTFVLQIAGSGIGYLWGLALLEMFRDVGGYKFNPIGITFMIVPYAVVMQYLLYEKPAFFVVALLGLNGTGVLVATEWIAVEHLRRPNFDSPAFRAGKALSALSVALAIVAIFQLFILRNPARRTLRKAVAALTYQTLSYAVLLQAFSRSMLTSSPDNRPSKPALLRIERELRHRELKIQSAIINSGPLLTYAAAEPQFSSPFKKDAIQRIIRSNQLILDRLREARAALGTQEFENFILTHFVGILAPYRARNMRLVKAQLYSIASSLQSKAPLPHFTPMSMLTDRDRADFIHDCLVLSARFSRTEEGKTSIGTREFMRYVSFLLCSTAVVEPLRAMEDASKELYGELESKLV